jgi:hypothetical protein
MSREDAEQRRGALPRARGGRSEAQAGRWRRTGVKLRVFPALDAPEPSSQAICKT